MQRANIVYGAGAILLGVIGLVVGDFAMQWQPVPADIPGRALLAYVAAAALLLAGVVTLIPRTSTRGAGALGVLYALWVVLLMLPRLVVQPLQLIRWNGLAEILALAAAGAVAYAVVKPALLRPARLAFGFPPLIFGTAHFVYADFTASMIPTWIPGPLFWAYATGCFHIAAGLSMLSGVLARLGATLLATMFAGFVLLLHVPRVVHETGSRLEWTMLAISTSLTGAALIVALSYRGERSLVSLRP
ncbi:DoxX family membrane protein [Roseiterribacter gracilis]